MSDDTPEEWRPVPGHEGSYEVSDLGRVRSLDRVISVLNRWGTITERHVRGCLLKSAANNYGHLHINVSRAETRTIHTLVAEAFLGPRPPGHEVRHGPGGKTDNRLVNLSYGTRAQNLGPDKVRDGTDPNGDRHGMAKLTWADVDEIRRRAAPPHRGPLPKGAPLAPTNEELAAEFGISRRTADRIVAGKAWRPEFRRHAS